MLERIMVENFKGLREVQISLSPLTVFVGENGTGKSTILQALSILKRSLGQAAITTDLTYANLGPLNFLVPPAQTCRISFEGMSEIQTKPFGVERVHVRCSVSFDVNGLSAYRTELKLGEQPPIQNEWNRGGANRIEPQTLTHGKVILNFSFTNTIGQGFQLAGYGFQRSPGPDEMNEALDSQQYFVKLSGAVKTILERFYVVAPLRGLTEHTFALQPNRTEEFTPRAGTMQLGSSLATNLEYNRPTTATISKWLDEIVGVGITTQLSPGAQVVVRNPERGTDYVNEGFGTNQLLFVLERIANSPSDSVIGVEEPEVHLHPKAQYKFGRWASRMAAKLERQLIVLTHSPDVISGILAGIRRKDAKPEDVSIWFFERKGREITATKSEVDQEGEVTGPALKSFLESTEAQLSEYS